MSDPDTKPSGGRPSKVTLASTLGGASCLVLIFSLFDTLGRLRGVDMRDQVAQTLSQPPFDTMTVTTGDVLAGMRVMAFGAGALAAAGLVLAVYVARRHQGARIGFTVVAALLLLTTPVAGMLTFLVGIAALLMWSEPARAWFGGREPRPVAARRQETLMSAGDRTPEGSSGGSSGGSWPPGPQGSDHGSSGSSGSSAWGASPSQPPASPSGASQPPPYSGSYGESGGSGASAEGSGQGQPDPQPWSSQPPSEPSEPSSGASAAPSYGQGDQGSVGYPSQQGPYGQGQGQPYGSPYGSSYGPPGYYGQGGSDPGKRPGTVTAAAVLTFIGALGGLLMGVILMAALSVDSTTLSDQLRQDPNFDQIGWDVDQVLSAVWVVAVVLTLWSLSAIVLAVFVLRRQQWARWLLVASAVMSALLSLVAILSLVSVVPLILSVATVVLLFAGGANAWFSGRGRGDQSQSGPQWSSSPGPW